MIEVYTRPQCGYCNTFKKSLDFYGLNYVEHVVDEDISKEQLKEKFPWATLLPIVIVNGDPLSYKEASIMLENFKEHFGKQLLNG